MKAKKTARSAAQDPEESLPAASTMVCRAQIKLLRMLARAAVEGLQQTEDFYVDQNPIEKTCRKANTRGG